MDDVERRVHGPGVIAEAAEAAVHRTNRRIVAAAAVLLVCVGVAAMVATAAGLTLVSDARDAAAAGRALVARQRRDDAERAVVTAAADAERARLTDEAIGRINEALAKGLELHDANIHADLEELRRLLAARSAPLPARTPITAPPPSVRATPNPPQTAPPPAATTTTTTTRPATTTTTCPRLPNGRCRP